MTSAKRTILSVEDPEPLPESVLRDFDEIGRELLKDCPLSQRIQGLTPQSSLNNIKEAFIKWNRGMLLDAIGAVLVLLEEYHEPLSDEEIKHGLVQKVDDKVGWAMVMLSRYRVVYGEIIESITESMTKNQFLTFMAATDPSYCGMESQHIRSGASEGGIIDLYLDELLPILSFRCAEAKRLLCSQFDVSYGEHVRREYDKYRESD